MLAALPGPALHPACPGKTHWKLSPRHKTCARERGRESERERERESYVTTLLRLLLSLLWCPYCCDQSHCRHLVIDITGTIRLNVRKRSAHKAIYSGPGTIDTQRRNQTHVLHGDRAPRTLCFEQWTPGKMTAAQPQHRVKYESPQIPNPDRT